MNWDRAWLAPAKLNLFLHVVGRRADGYHLLQTVFRFIDLADSLRFEPRSDGRIELATPTPGVPPEQDLTVRAAHALKSHKSCIRDTAVGVTVHLDKRIPMGGGLGGGSSDAATTLLALNHLWNGGLSRTELAAIGLNLGADVPVFIHGRNCFAEGVGERFTDVSLPGAAYVLTQPAAHVPTADIFRAPELRRDTPVIRPADWQPGFGHNDLEPVAVARHPEIGRHLAALRALGDARMTGSGACCFVTFSDVVAAAAAQTQLSPDLNARVVRGLDCNPATNGL